MIANLRSIDLQMNSRCQYQKKHTVKRTENMDTDVRVLLGNSFLSSKNKKNENGEEKNCLKGEGLYWPFKWK